ncbi:MAG: hypothetical protein AB7G37_01090 [Solirubrobacteraceae bacterium]
MSIGRLLVAIGAVGVLVAAAGAFSWPFAVVAASLLGAGLGAGAARDDIDAKNRALTLALLERLASQPAAKSPVQSAATKRLMDDLSLSTRRYGGQG